jgi:GH24 family phage-related lysozyme (muramidase)
MKTLRYILEVDNTDYDKNRTSDPMSKPKNKKNVLFVGDANTKDSNSYARQLINSGVVTGEIRATFEATAVEILKLIRTHNSAEFDIVSIQYSNIFPGKLNTDIDALKAALDAADEFGAKVILISNPSKTHVPYGHVKYENDLDIWNWITKQQNEADYTIDIRNITDNKSFFEKNGLLFNKDTQNLITKLWLDVLKDIDPDSDTATIKKQDQRKSLTKTKTKKLKNYIKGQKDSELIPIQKRLDQLDYGIENSKYGIMDDSTIEAIKKFQKLNGLAVTGQLSDKMIALLNSPAAIEYSDWKYAMKNVLSPEKAEVETEQPAEDDADSYISSGGSYIMPAYDDADSYSAAYTDSVTKQAAAILRREESFSSQPGYDVNNWRVGFGSSTITKPDGTVIKLPADKFDQPNIKISIQDAERDLQRRLRDEFVPRTIKSIGPVASELNNATIAALTSVTYNYGTLPGSVVTACQTKDVKQIANAVRKLSSNKRRRNREANWIESSMSGGAATNQPVASNSGTATLTYSNRAQQDKNAGIINPELISDIEKALKIAGVSAAITTAKTGHSVKTTTGNISRHGDGNAVDISVINGIRNASGNATNRGIGNAQFMADGDKIVAALKTLGYQPGEGPSNLKAFIWRSDVGGNHWNHIHVSNKVRNNTVA